MGKARMLPLVIVACIACQNGPGEPRVTYLLENADVPTTVLTDTALENAELKQIRINAIDERVYPFTTILATPLDAAGNMYVLDRLARTIVVFDSDQHLVRTIGKPGMGPGELSNPRQLLLGGDTLFVLDSPIRMFSLDGKSLGLMHTKNIDVDRQLTMLDNVAYTKVGLAAFSRVSGTDTQESVDTSIARLLVAGSFSPPIVRRPEAMVNVTPGLRSPTPLGRIIPIVADYQARFIVAERSEFAIRVYDREGHLIHRIVARVPGVKTTSQDLQDELRTRKDGWANMVGEQIATRFARDFSKLPRTRIRPAIGQILVSPGGDLLIQRMDVSSRPYRSDDSGLKTRWLILDSLYKPIGNVDIPNNIRLLSFRNCAASGYLRTNTDVPTPLVLTIEGCN